MKVSHTFRKLIFGAFVFVAFNGVAEAAAFPDVSFSHPNAVAIDFLTTEGVISGYPDGNFQPENFVNRAETLKILLLASGITIQAIPQNEFPDVPDEAWFASFVASARAREIADGYPDGFFRPGRTVNLVEALKMLFAANEVQLENYKTETKLFADSEESAWYNSFLFYAKTFEIVESDSADQVFPATPLTRGQLAEIVYRFFTRVEAVCPRLLENSRTIPANYFREISLVDGLPNIFYEDEVFGLVGSVAEDVESVTVVFENRESNEHTQFSADVEENNFSLAAEFRVPGHYNFSIIPSTTDRNSAASIEVLPRECAPATIESGGIPPENLRAKILNNEPMLAWDSGDNNLFRAVIRQNENRFERLVSANQDSLVLDPADFENFEAGEATFQIFGAKSEHGFSYEPRTQWSASSPITLDLSQHHFSTFEEEQLTLLSLPIYRGPRISFSGTAGTDLESTAHLITPAGMVEEVSILPSTSSHSTNSGQAGQMKEAEEILAGTSFTLNLQLPEVGTYILEINAANGIAALNHPFYLPNEFPLLPDFTDLRESPNLQRKISVNRERAIWLRLVNEFRASQRLPAVKLDEEISKFAQDYAEQMATENFFGHIDLSGDDPDARRKLAGLPLPVGENLARDSKTEYAHAGLLRSAAHRANILAPEWTRVGLGIAKDVNGQLFFVQEFSTDLLVEENSAEFKSELYELINSRRREENTVELISDPALNLVAQGWSEKMAEEDFLDFVHGGESLENSIRAAGYDGSFASFIASAGKLSQIVGGLSEDVFTDSTKSRVAIGLAQDSNGSFRATFVFRE
ncbi:S-layer homology domain-containing protein [Candidatus Gracilibacteria bacterium]|nr:S-layer homology domain-containing protein [Candidatus Gracilibacteria bacterium]